MAGPVTGPLAAVDTGPAAVPTVIRSRDNPLLKRLQRQLRSPGGYRASGQVWLEGDHLLDALLRRGHRPDEVLLTGSAWAQPRLRALAGQAAAVRLLDDALFAQLSELPSPAAIGALWTPPAPGAVAAQVDTLVLDRVQDAGNVGSMLRSAAALGVRQVLALKGTAALWSPKVLRAGMGAHMALQLHEGLAPDDLQALAVPLVATALDAAQDLTRVRLPQPCAWVMGHEGQGVDAALQARCALRVRIPQPGGEESLNVAAATAVCLYEAMRQRLPAG